MTYVRFKSVLFFSIFLRWPRINDALHHQHVLRGMPALHVFYTNPIICSYIMLRLRRCRASVPPGNRTIRTRRQTLCVTSSVFVTSRTAARTLPEHLASGSFLADVLVCLEFRPVVATPPRLACPFSKDRGLLEGIRSTPCPRVDRRAPLVLDGRVSFGHRGPDRLHALEGRQSPFLLRVQDVDLFSAPIAVRSRAKPPNTEFCDLLTITKPHYGIRTFPR